MDVNSHFGAMLSTETLSDNLFRCDRRDETGHSVLVLAEDLLCHTIEPEVNVDILDSMLLELPVPTVVFRYAKGWAILSGGEVLQTLAAARKSPLGQFRSRVMKSRVDTISFDAPYMNDAKVELAIGLMKRTGVIPK